MPELPDITVYIEALDRRIRGATLTHSRLRSPFVLRTFEPPIEALDGGHVCEIRRLGKRIAIGFEDDRWLVCHLMVAGRLHWNRAVAAAANKQVLCEFEFDSGRLSLTEAGSKRRASLHLVTGPQLQDHDPGGLEVLEVTQDEFAHRIQAQNHTLKRALTHPKILSGIGNSYSDEILHRARLSPVKLTQKLDAAELQRLFLAVGEVLRTWTETLRAECGDGFPKRVTAFRAGMAVHGRFGEPCPSCGETVQRIRYKNNETNYCPRCQTGGKLLSDRSLARLLKADWPAQLDD